MRQYERNGVHVDQCTDCRGLFLDRGELEHLIDAERAWSQPQPAPAGTPPAQQPGQSSQGQSHQGQVQGRSYGYSKPKKRRSFFEELLRLAAVTAPVPPRGSTASAAAS
ncbi:MAG TPA: zf-TFIIB domain-containing protein [Actinomycetes bacterium]|nr:zf-TFIIB domain-containing protein [Actinomycetes bacterium]